MQNFCIFVKCVLTSLIVFHFALLLSTVLINRMPDSGFSGFLSVSYSSYIILDNLCLMNLEKQVIPY